MSTYASYKSLGKDLNAPKKESMAEIPRITSLEHRNMVKQTYHIVVIENYTDWCGPCKTIAPLFAQMAKKYLDAEMDGSTRFSFVKENVDDDIEGILSVRGVPCFHIFIDGVHSPECNVTGGDIVKITEHIADIMKNN